jgi:hypothetical protein
MGQRRRMRSLTAIEPGTWADWANASATALAFLVALVLARYALHDRHRANELQRRDQARKVWIWYESGQQSSILDTTDAPKWVKLFWRVENTSDQPITACRVAMADTSSNEVLNTDPAIRVLPPGKEKEGEEPYSEVITEDNRQPRLQLIFKDSAGVQWKRDTDGNLEEVRLKR